MTAALHDRVHQAARLIETHGARAKIFAGYTANLDLIVRLAQADGDWLSRELGDFGSGTDGGCAIHTPSDLGRALRTQIERGKGGEWPLEDQATYDWMQARFAGAPALGGTGAQAAATLAHLGFRPTLNLPARDPRLIALLPAGVRSPGRADAAKATVHFIFEFEAGFALRNGDRAVVAAAGDRLIVPFDPARCEFAIVQDYWAESVGCDAPKTILASGYNVPGDAAVIEQAVAATERHLEDCRGSGRMVHLEFGESHLPPARRAVIERLLPCVDSIGLNVHELATLVHDLDHSVAPRTEPADLIPQCVDIASRFGLLRLNLHTSRYAIAISRLDPEVEIVALAFGHAVAAYRAAHGRLGDLSEVLAYVAGLDAQPHRAADVTHDVGTSAGYHIVQLPAFDLTLQRQAVGLGDSHTAGVLGVLAIANALNCASMKGAHACLCR